MKKISNEIVDKLEKQHVIVSDLDSATIEYFVIRWMQTKELEKHYGNDTELGAATRLLARIEHWTDWKHEHINMTEKHERKNKIIDFITAPFLFFYYAGSLIISAWIEQIKNRNDK